ncbi:MAG: hypothetical protein QOJ39_362 [Candidatus Eremiobacteraeota bacterium]|jgi:hypothetical protein|nr:hypothetical protein [Candidatus Eremiobacteraeota bacterium]MEA2718498.1 hypothetical protein [Candidatus Eremiobacteraeota bacterium]
MSLRTLAAAAALLLLSPALTGATPAIPGLSSSGTLVVQASVQGEPVNVGGKVALYHKGTMYRLDLLSLGFPGVGGDLSALAATLIGPGGVSMLYDGATGSITAWSNANKTYYSDTPSRGTTTAQANNAAANSAPPNPGDPLAALANLATALRDVQTATIQMTGHSMVNGHPSTGLDVQMKRQLPGKPLENYHAQLALADDLNDFPIQIALQSVPATKSAFGGTMKLDLTTVQRDNPDDNLFTVPQGYTRVTSLSNILRPPGR